MRQEFASESKPKTGSNASVSLTKRTPFNRGAGKSLNIVFSRGLRAARTGGVVAAIPFACHTVRRRQRKNLLPNNPPLGFSLGTVTTTETLSTEATPEHHRGCFNAPKFPLVLDSDLPSSPTTIANPQPIRRPRPHTRHPRLRSGTCYHTRHVRRFPRPTPSGDVGARPLGRPVIPKSQHTRHPRPAPSPSFPALRKSDICERSCCESETRSCTMLTFPYGPPSDISDSANPEIRWNWTSETGSLVGARGVGHGTRSRNLSHRLSGVNGSMHL